MGFFFKVIKIFFIILISLVIIIYINVFTGFNKFFLIPFIENKIKEELQIKDVSIPILSVSFSDLKMEMILNREKINLDADFNILKKTIKASYKIDIKDLLNFETLTKEKLKGSLLLEGKLEEDGNLIGNLQIFKGNINYFLNIDMKNSFNISNILLKIESIELSEALYSINQPKYISGKLNSDINISSLKLKNMSLIGNIKNGSFNKEVFQKSLSIDIPNDTFSLNTDVKVVDNSGKISYNFDSNLIKLIIDGKIDLITKLFNSTYNIDIKKLRMLEPIIKTKINGSFKTSGVAEGNITDIKVIGKTDVAEGDTKYKVLVKNKKIDKINAQIKNIKLDKLLFILNQPKYAKANLNIDLNINSWETLNGKILLNLKNGILNKTIVKRDFNISLPKKPYFTLNLDATLINKDLIKSELLFNSFVGKLKMKDSIRKKDIFTTNFTLNISDLNKLKFITKQKMRGDFNLNGDLKFDKNLTVNFNSKKFDGLIKGNLIDNQLKIKLKEISSISLLKTLYYPEVFNSKFNIDFQYDLKNLKGISYLESSKGNFIENKLTKNVNKFLKIDLTKEVYDEIKIETKIYKKLDHTILNSSLLIKNSRSGLKSDKIYMDLNSSSINSKFNFYYKKFDIDFAVKGALTHPNVKFDFKNILKTLFKEKVNKKLKDKITKEKEKIKNKLKETIEKEKSNIINNFKSFF